MSKYSLVLDSSQISTFLECNQLWYNQYVKRLVPTFVVPKHSEPMNAGTYGHKLLDIYYRARVKGLPLNEAAAVAFSYDPDKDTCECGCTLDVHKYLSIVNATECQRCHKCLSFRPKQFELDESVRMAVRNRVREYFFTYQNNDFKPLSEQHVEIGFSERIYEDSENLFVLEGRIDMLGSLQGLECVVDHKFQMRRHSLYAKCVQFRNYALIAQKCLFVINYIRLSKSVDKDTLVRELVNFTVPELILWKQKLISIYFRIKKAQQLAESGGQLDQNFGACPGRFNYQCNYTELCEASPEVALLKEKQLYRINETPWRPW